MTLNKQTEKTIVVLGRARGGTSMTCGILNILGVNFGENLATPDEHNPKGLYEDKEIVKLFVRINKAAGGNPEKWEAPSQQEVLKLKDDFDNEIKEIMTRKIEGSIFGFKGGSGIELFLPYLPNPHIVMIYRNPLDVAKSVQRMKKEISLQKGISDALNGYAEIINFLNRHPDLPRVFISFEKILRDPIQKTQKLADFLSVSFTQEQRKQVDKFVIPRSEIQKERRKAIFKGVWYRILRFFKKCEKEPTKSPIFTWKALKLIKNRVTCLLFEK